MMTFTPSSEDVRIYECLLLLPLGLAEEAFQETPAAVQQLFSEKGGKLLYKEDWGRQGLAYPIKKRREGRFILFVAELPPGATPALEAALLLEKGVLRHLLVKTPKHHELVPFAERMGAWQKEKEQRAQEEEATREERLKQRIVKRAVRAVPAPSTPVPKETVAGERLEEGLGKLISDADLHL